MVSRTFSLMSLALLAAAPAAAQARQQLSCTLGKATVFAILDRSDGSVTLSNARNSKTQSLTATFSGAAVSFSDGEDPVALLYTIDSQSMRIDRWISDGSEGRTHLDDGKCRAFQFADAAAASVAEPFKAP